MTGVVIVTTGHHPEDGRLGRHVRTLREAGYGARIEALNASNRIHRILKAVPFLARTLRPRDFDVLIVPDPELYVIGPILGRVMGQRTVIDIHEDYAAVALRRAWIPRPLRWMAALLAGLNSRMGRAVADAVVVAAPHLERPGDIVVTNLPGAGTLPAPALPPEPRAVYVGDISRDRGADEMVEVLARVDRLRLDLIGPLSEAIRADIARLADRLEVTNRLTIHGRLPYLEAWKIAAGATAGLSLLRPTPAYMKAIPTKLWEYFACGLPVIATNLPGQSAVVTESGGGVVVRDTIEAAEILNRLLDEPALASALGDAGYQFYLKRVGKDDSARQLVRAVTEVQVGQSERG